MTVFRRITADDIQAVVDYATWVLSKVDAPMHVSPRKVRAAVEHFASTPGDFNLIAERDGRIVGAIAAFVSEMPWYERCEAHVAICHAEPGAGLPLLRALKRWAEGEMRIRRVVWAHNADVDPRFIRLAERMGFVSQTMSVLQKG